MKYIVYCTTNIINNKIYIGLHETENPYIFDGYIGNSINIYESNPELNNPKLAFHRAVKKYGFDAFKREVIKVFDTLEEAQSLEAEIVDEEFLKRKDVYNMTIGGGMPPLHDKKVYQYSLEGNFIKEWKSLTDAANYYNTSGNIIGISANHKRTSLNYLWSFEKVEKLDVSEYNVHTKKHNVYLYNNNGNFIRCYESVYSCAKDLNIYLAKAQRALSLGNSINGYYLSYCFDEKFIKPKTIQVVGNIHQYNLDGTYIKSYNDIDCIIGFNKNDIRRAIKENRTHKGFIWICGEKLESVSPRKGKSDKKKIGQYTQDNELVKIFDTLESAKKVFPNVSKVLRGQAKYCHGFVFKYLS